MSKENNNIQQQVDAEKKKEHTSVLEKIRRRTGLLVGIVGLALVIFILESLLGSGASIFGDNEMMNIGSINGKNINRNEFINRVDLQLNMIRQQKGSTDIDEATSKQVKDYIWQQYVSDLVIKPQYEKIGINVTEDEIYERVVVNPVQSIIQQLSDPKTGRVNEQFAKPDGTIDPVKWRNAVQQLPPEQEKTLEQMENSVKEMRYAEKYATLIRKGLYATKAEVKEAYKAQNNKINFTYVIKRFDSVSDSTVKVTDEDIQKFYTDHSYMFSINETYRKIEYVSYDVLPSPTDLEAIAADAKRAADEFKGKTIREDSNFIAQESENGVISITDMTKKTMIVQDSSIFTAPVGTVFGPYNEGAYFKIYKLEGINTISDSGKVRHLLVAYEGSERSQATRSKVQAKKLADSLLTLLKKGGSFDQLVDQFSDDGGKKKPNINFSDPTIQPQLSQILFDVKDTNSWRGKGGNYGWIKANQQGMAPEFVQGATENKKGDIFIKESPFGYHIMEVTDASKTNFNSYKVAQIFKLIEPSEETNQAIFGKANQFAGENNTGELFDKAVDKQKLTKRISDNIKEGERQLAGLDNAKELVKWVYTAKKGDVSVFSLNDKHVVVKLAGIKNKGILPLEDVKDDVRLLAIKDKKAQTFIAEFNAKAGNSKNVDEIATKLGLEAKKQENLTLASHNVEGLGHDDILMGTAIGTKAGSTTKAIAGDNGVFVLNVVSISESPIPEDLKMQKMQIEQANGGRADYEAFNALKEIANIEDHTSRLD